LGLDDSELDEADEVEKRRFEMARTRSEILKTIEETQARIGELAEAVASKVDVRTQAEDFVSEKKESLRATADAVVSNVSDATRDSGDRSPEPPAAVQPRSVTVAVGALALGFRLGKRLSERALRTGEDALARLRQAGRDSDTSGD
jgi:cell division septum initiation protein DivIVA